MKPRLFIAFTAAVLLLLQYGGQPGQAQDSAVDHPDLTLTQRLELGEAAITSDPDSTAQFLGLDVIDIVAFVREQIDYQHYRGILRGSQGTLAARAGNSFDQAILLQRMLKNARVDAELWRGVLATPWADKLRKASSITRFSQKSGDPAYFANEEPLEQMISMAIARRADLRKEIEETTKRLVASLPDDFGEALHDSQPGSGPMDYMWVRIRREEGFVDIHPCFAESDLVEVTEMGYAEVQTSLPDALYHRVRVRLIAERPAENNFTRQVLLERSILPAAMTGKTAKVYLRSSITPTGELAVQPTLRFGFITMTGEELRFPYDSERTPQGGISALYLELTALSPGAAARQHSLTIADVLPPGTSWQQRDVDSILAAPALQPDAFRFSADILVMGGAVTPLQEWRNELRLEATAAALIQSNREITSEQLQFLFKHHLFLQRFASVYSRSLAAVDSFISGPSVFTVLTRPAETGTKLERRFSINHLDVTGAPIHCGLLAAVALVQVFDSGAVEIPESWTEAGDEKPGADDPNAGEISLEKLRGSIVLIAGSGRLWLRIPRGGAHPILHGQGDALSSQTSGWVDHHMQSHDYILPFLFGLSSQQPDIRLMLSSLLQKLGSDPLSLHGQSITDQ